MYHNYLKINIMKNLILVFSISLLSIINACAQNFPEPPKTPNTGNMHTEITSSVSNSTSVSNSGNIYKFTSKFQSSKHNGVKDILKDELDAIQLEKSNNQYIWKKQKGRETIFECILKNNTLKILLNKDESTYRFNKKIKNLGNELRKYISAHKNFSYANSSNSVSDAQLRVEKAKEELKRSVRNLEKVKRKTGN